jgi:hypothetical protein
MSVVLGLIYEIVNTLILLLAKSMERHGIETFSRKKSMKEKGVFIMNIFKKAEDDLPKKINTE